MEQRDDRHEFTLRASPHFVVQLVSFDKNCDAHVYATSPPFAVAPDPSCPHPQAPVIIRIG